MGIPDYPRIERYIWAFSDHYEVHVDSYMCNQGIKVVYLGFYYVYINTKIKAVYK